MSDVGVPTRLTTDGGPQFRSSAFASFCSEWNICHDPSSPYNPQSNGAAEAAVKALKHLLMKIGKGDAYNSSAFREGLLEWRNTPGAGGASPTQLLFGRPTRTKVPTLPANLQQYAAHSRSAPQQVSSQLGKPLPPLHVGDKV